MPTIKDIKQAQKHTDLPRHWWQNWLLFVINQPASCLIANDDYMLCDDEYIAFQNGMVKMTQGVPLAYLVGSQEFFGFDFVVNKHTLIPRPDTERLVEAVLDWVNAKAMPSGRVLDLGTGSGCIAISLAKHLPAWQVLGVDKSKAALQVANDNAKRLKADNCQFMYSDWFGDVGGKFDIIVSNPPYIANDDVHLHLLHHEPISALIADDNGLLDIIHIAKNATAFFKPDGLFAIEHGHDQGCAVHKILTQNGYDKVQTIKDYGDNDRLAMGVWRG